jgi:hypothetical protein
MLVAEYHVIPSWIKRAKELNEELVLELSFVVEKMPWLTLIGRCLLNPHYTSSPFFPFLFLCVSETCIYYSAHIKVPHHVFSVVIFIFGIYYTDIAFGSCSKARGVHGLGTCRWWYVQHPPTSSPCILFKHTSFQYRRLPWSTGYSHFAAWAASF